MDHTLLLLFCALGSFTSTHGLAIRETTTSDGAIGDLNVFKDIAADTNFTEIESSKVEDENSTTVNVINDTIKEEKLNLSMTNETVSENETIDKVEVKPENGTGTSGLPATATSPISSVTTVKPTGSVSVDMVNKTTSLNETFMEMDDKFVDPKTVNKVFSDFDEILNAVNATSDTTNNTIETGAGGIAANDEFSNLTGKYSGLTRIRALLSPESQDDDKYKPPIDVTVNTEVIKLTTDVPENEMNYPAENDEDDESAEIIVDEPRTKEAEDHWSKFSKATGYKIIWGSSNDSKTRNTEDEDETGHSIDGGDVVKIEKEICEPEVNSTKYFSDEINYLTKAKTLVGSKFKRLIGTIRCAVYGLAKIAENHQNWIEYWSEESTLPTKEIDRLERKMADHENYKCNCSAPLVGDVIHDIYADPFLHEQRFALYKNPTWSSIVTNLRLSHGKIKLMYSQISRNQLNIEKLMNVSVTMSQLVYQQRAQQLKQTMNSLRNKRLNPYRRYSHG